MNLPEIIEYLRTALANAYSVDDSILEQIIADLAATKSTDISALTAIADRIGLFNRLPGMESYDSSGILLGSLDAFNAIIDG